MNKILFIDTLTTGMNTERCAIYKIGGIYTEDGVEKKRFEFRMRPFPGARISDQSLWIGGVDRSVLASYPESASAFAEFVDMLDGFVEMRNSKDKMYIAGFNASAFDVPFLWEWFRKNGNDHNRDYFHMQVIDIMTISAFFLMDQRRRMQDFKLESVARFMDVYSGEGDTCDCIQNAKTCLDLYRKYMEQHGLGEFTETGECDEIITNIR